MLQLSNSEWDTLFRQLHRTPPDMEVALISFYETIDILISTIPELQANTAYSYSEMWNIVSQTQNNFFYQFTSPSFINSRQNLFILSRAGKSSPHRKRPLNFINHSIALLLSLAALLTIVIWRISHNIFSSITILENRSQKIADGDLTASLIEELPKNRSNEIISLTENLEKMRKSLLNSQEQRARFIMGISHDLRTPIAVIKGYTEALSDNVVTNPSEITKSLEIITAKTNQLENMIDTLINFVKLDSADWQEKLTSESIAAVAVEFAQSAEMIGSVFKRKVSSVIDISPEVSVPMDKQLFLRALENLISNAIRYSKEGDAIAITGSETPSSCVITVQDTGIGIEEKECEHIFDMFYRATNSRREEGMGIGLAVVKSIIDTHGWEIAVKSELGKGTTFIITIPKNHLRTTTPLQ